MLYITCIIDSESRHLGSFNSCLILIIVTGHHHERLQFIPSKQVGVTFDTKTNAQGLSPISNHLSSCQRGNNSYSGNSSSFKDEDQRL